MAAHAKLSASSAKRWLTCPGSVALSEGVPETTSRAAEEGSAAHALAEFCLLEEREPFEFLGESCPDPDYAEWEVTQDMVDAVTVYTDFVRNYPAKVQKNRIEVRLDLSPVDDHFKDMFGTCDHLYWDHKNRVLHVDDYKHGVGVVVEPTTDQCKYYALAALHMGKILNAVEWIQVTIIQPRAKHPDGPIRSIRYSVDDLMQWMRDTLRPGVIAVKDPDAPRIPDPDACRFCPGKGKCPELRDKAMEEAKLEFDFMGEAQPVKPLPELTPGEIADILDNAKFIGGWLDGVKEYALNQLKARQDVTGGRHKLVHGKKSRAWRNEEEAVKKLCSLGVDKGDLYKETFVTPAQAEKLVPRDKKTDLKECIVESEGGPVLAPASDKRAAWSNAEEDFADTPESPDDDLSFLD